MAAAMDEMHRVLQNDYVDAALCVALMALVVALVGLGVRAALKARRSAGVTTQETPYVAA